MFGQEEERERRMDFVPEESAVNTDLIEVRTSLQAIARPRQAIIESASGAQWPPRSDQQS